MTELAAVKRKFTIMASVIAVCAVVAIGALAASFVLKQDWLFGVFFVALAAGFGAQIWFVVGFMRAKKGV